MIGKEISHYRIIEKIGQGGLGEVFLAEDTILSRRVAMKFLTKTDDSIAHDQIIAEARSAALIDHPYTCKVFEAGECDGKSFIVMEYIEGETLAHLLKAGRIPFSQTMIIAREITEALADAHDKAIVHCDLKPANVMIARSGGHVKLMDFGLARIVRWRNDNQDATEQITTSGVTIVGTPAYMPPEQARGDNLDPRADVFAFGIIFFEMLAGFHPFRRKTPQATIAAILHEPAPQIEDFVDGISPDLAQMLRRMLAKDPADRYPSARELWADLAQMSAGPGSSSEPGAREALEVQEQTSMPVIAILPFIDYSPEANQAYLCYGLAEDLITSLGKLDSIRVASRTASFRYKNAEVNLQEIRNSLKANSILEGSVQKVGDRLRIMAKLVDVETGYPVWSEKYDRKIDDVFQVQDEISHAIVEKLQGTLALPANPKVNRNRRNGHAYEFYLKGRFFWNKRNEENLKLSIEQFEKALLEDPFYELAFAGLADAYVTLSLYGAMAPMEAMTLARDAADRALEVNPHLPEALTARACVRAVFDWDWKSAGQEFESAIRLNPQNAQAHQWYAMNCLAPVGEFQRASHQLSLAAELEPVSLAIATSRGILNFYQRDFEQAIGEFQSALVLDEGFYLAHYFLGLIYAEQRMYDESLRELERASEVTHGSPNTIAALGYKGALAGHRIEAQYALEVLSRQRKERYVSPVLLAQLQASLKDYEGALTSLEEAYGERATDLIWINFHPAFDSVRTDPRFMDLVYKVGLVKADQSIHQSLTKRPL